MSGSDCEECGEHFLSCHCVQDPEKGSWRKEYGPLQAISDDQLYQWLCQNNTRDAAFLAIISSEVLRRQQEKLYKPSMCEDDA